MRGQGVFVLGLRGVSESRRASDYKRASWSCSID